MYQNLSFNENFKFLFIREYKYFFVRHSSFRGTFLVITINKAIITWLMVKHVSGQSLPVVTFNRLAALCNHWSDQSSLSFMASMKVSDPPSRSTLLNVSKYLNPLFRLVLLSQTKHFSVFLLHNFFWLTAHSYIWRFSLL